MAPSPTVDVVLVNWNSGDYLRRAVSSIGHAREDIYRLGRVVVVDNASSDKSVMDMPTLGGRLLLDRAGSNLGFARGCNRGARHGSADYILFLNPDTALPPSSISACVRTMEDPTHAQIGICGVRLVDEHGNPTICVARFPTLSVFVSKVFGLSHLFPSLFTPHFLPPGEPTKSGVVDQIIGASFFVRRRVFEECKGFDEQFFMYFEEVDFSLRARQLGHASYFLADEAVFHKGGGSSEKVKAFRLTYSWRSRIAFAAKHFSKSELVVLFMITVLVEPVARVAAAVLRGSFSEALDTAKAWVYFMFRRTNWTRN